MITKYASIFALMQFASVLAFAQTNSATPVTKQAAAQTSESQADTEWISYRNAYRLMIQFEKYGKPKHLIQNHFQLVSKNGGPLPDNLQLNLVSKSMRLNLPLDAAGRASFPLLKSAYDENAELVLNQTAGQVNFQSRISIIARSDGVYEIADLRLACEQALAYVKSTGDARISARSCVGVRFSYAKNLQQAGIKFRGADMQMHALALQENSAFPDESNKAYKIANLRFADTAEKGQLLAQQAPIAIAPLFE
ncbi:hypothetical protein [Undibacterium pigrum]|uniref:Uncharacterized protein n=1 Tax=Undibacterium pigrum TaxID=401470 RepID=A0A318JGK0_9BURK|nr:hypothetical protein [Undibacterium pigrum]PXX47716.1 hypothetical protein DFR42_1011313 [Undibacterium pigrum]